VHISVCSEKPMYERVGNTMTTKRTDKQKKTRHRKSRSRSRIPPLNMDPETYAIIQQESDFLGITPEEYCKLVVHSAQLIRESVLSSPVQDPSMLRSILESPVLLMLVRTLATKYLSSAWTDLLGSLKDTSLPNSEHPSRSSPPPIRSPYPLPSPMPYVSQQPPAPWQFF
jgi:hypothetical protein